MAAKAKHNIFIMFMLITGFQAKAQDNYTLYFMHTLPQANILNPAVQIPCKVYIGIPALSSIHVGYSNTLFTYKDVISTNQSGNNIFKPDYFINAAGDLENIRLETQISLIHFGFFYKDIYFNFHLQDKVDLGLNYSGNLISLALKGNAPHIGETFDAGGTALHGIYYREWGIGASKKIDNQWTLGIHAKLLFGKINIQTRKKDLAMTTTSDSLQLSASGHYLIKASPFVVTTDAQNQPTSIKLADASIVSLLLNRQNPGISFDFGTLYQLDDNTTVAASLLDIGGIYWRYSPAQVDISGSYNFNGIQYDPITGTFNNLDSVVNAAQDAYSYSTSQSSYFTFLPPKLYLGAAYNLNDWANASLTYRSEYYHGKILQGVSPAINAKYKNFLAGSLSWTFTRGTLMNFGAGISARTPTFGFYAIADNVYGMIKWKSTKFVNLRFGFNLLFGCSSGKSKGSSSAACSAYGNTLKKKQRLEELKSKSGK